MNFIANAIGNINHAERLAVNTQMGQAVSFDQDNDISTIQNAIRNLNQTNNSFSLQQSLKTIMNTLMSFENSSNIPKTLITFVSDTNSENAIGRAQTYADYIKTHGFEITFVLMGPNTDQSKLTNITNSFVNWSDMSQPEPTNWNAVSKDVYGCESVESTVQPVQSTSSTRRGLTVHTVVTFQPATTTNAQTMATGPGPDPGYAPCQQYVIIAGDDTRMLTSANFQVGSFSKPNNFSI